MIVFGQRSAVMLAVAMLMTFGATRPFAQTPGAPATGADQADRPGMPPTPESSGLTVEMPKQAGPLPMQAPQPHGLVPATAESQASGPVPVPTRSTLQGPSPLPIGSGAAAPMPVR